MRRYAQISVACAIIWTLVILAMPETWLWLATNAQRLELIALGLIALLGAVVCGFLFMGLPVKRND